MQFNWIQIKVKNEVQDLKSALNLGWKYNFLLVMAFDNERLYFNVWMNCSPTFYKLHL